MYTNGGREDGWGREAEAVLLLLVALRVLEVEYRWRAMAVAVKVWPLRRVIWRVMDSTLPPPVRKMLELLIAMYNTSFSAGRDTTDGITIEH